MEQNLKKRSLCAQFRLGTLPLTIETGRFTGLLEGKKGLLHFILDCSLVYVDLGKPSIIYNK